MALIVLLVINLLIVSINGIDSIRNEEKNFDDLLKTQLDSNLIKWTESRLQPAIKKLPGSPEKNLLRTIRQLKQTKYKVYVEELESTVYNILYEQIPAKKNIAGIELMVLKGFLDICYGLLPRSNGNAHTVLKEMKTMLDNKNDWTGEFFWRTLVSIELKNPLINNNWITCKNDNNKVQCGMWLLFHTFTTEAYAGPNLDYIYRIKVLNHIVNYIIKFNPDLVSKTELQLEPPQDLKEGILWLWQVGNLARNLDYPDSSVCSECRRKDGSFDNQSLFMFIMNLHRNVYYKNETLVSLYPKGQYDRMG